MQKRHDFGVLAVELSLNKPPKLYMNEMAKHKYRVTL